MLSELKYYLYLSSDQLNQAKDQAKGVLFTLRHILHNGQSIIIYKRTENNYHMILSNFFSENKVIKLLIL